MTDGDLRRERVPTAGRLTFCELNRYSLVERGLVKDRREFVPFSFLAPESVLLLFYMGGSVTWRTILYGFSSSCPSSSRASLAFIRLADSGH
jgi:hypothetical protein